MDQLRSFPDLIAYLDARAKLPLAFRRVIGNERLLLHYYMMQGESFDGCVRPDDLLNYVLGSEAEFRLRVETKRKADTGAHFIESLADAQ